jgi:hypothetical protein
MTRLLATTTLALALSALPLQAEAHHGRPYSANVRHARQWLRDHTHKGAFRAAHVLWERESGWAVHARAGTCWGIPQSCPGHKMAAAGWDWRTDATTQVRWGTRYVRARYGTFRKALAHQRAFRWY